MTPELALILSGFASGAAGGFFAPEGQEISSFQDFGIDIPFLLKQGLTDIEAVKEGAFNLARQPVGLRSSFAQQPPVFTGGGLPQPIGVTGIDPALLDPSVLFTPGALDTGEFSRLDFGPGSSAVGRQSGPTRLPLTSPAAGASTSAPSVAPDSATQAVGAARLLLEELLDIQAQQGRGLFT